MTWPLWGFASLEHIVWTAGAIGIVLCILLPVFWKEKKGRKER